MSCLTKVEGPFCPQSQALIWICTFTPVHTGQFQLYTHMKIAQLRTITQRITELGWEQAHLLLQHCLLHCPGQTPSGMPCGMLGLPCRR